MRTISEAERAVLVNALVEQKPFYGEGTWRFPSEELNLFLRKEPWCLSLSKDAASTAELDNLSQACEPATFGMNEEDALNPSFRRPRKLDKKDFAINLDIVGCGLLQAVHDALFGLEDAPRNVRAELNELHVYGPGSFARAHNETPLSEDMFGSLILHFPVKHEGGALVLRHAGNEATHDAATANYTSPEQVSWIAFSSDAEHEVLPVTSGYRVTITYNLHFTNNSQSGLDAADSESESTSTPVGAALRTLLRSETFLPHGGQLGFGLQHQYAIPTDEPAQSIAYNTKLRGALRGADRALYDACDELGLCPCLWLAYAPERGGVFLLDHVFEGDVGFELGDWDEGLGGRAGARKIEPGDDDDDEDECDYGEDMVWVTPRQSTKTRVRSYYATYGDKVVLGKIYGELVLIATVPPKRERHFSPEFE